MISCHNVQNCTMQRERLFNVQNYTLYVVPTRYKLYIIVILYNVDRLYNVLYHVCTLGCKFAEQSGVE